MPTGSEGGASFDLGWCDVRFGAETEPRALALLRLSDGSRDLQAIASSLDWPVQRVSTLATAMYARGLIEDATLHDVDVLLAQEHLVAWGRTVRARMSAEVNLLGQQPQRRLLLGSLVETYHYVSSASLHIGAAVAHAPSRRTRDGLSKLFTDEWKHGHDLRRGLLAAGLSDALLEASEPLPETRAVIHYLYTLASTDLLAYGICAAINESPRSDTAIKAQWDSLAGLGLLPSEAITPFRGHEIEDEASGHASISELVFCEHANVSGAQQRRIRGHVVSFIETQRACYEALKDYYGPDDGPSLFSPA
jgi:hypothetical protein